MKKLLALLIAASVAMSGSVVLLDGSAASAGSPGTTSGVLSASVLTHVGTTNLKGGKDDNKGDGYCNGPSIEVYVNGRGYKDDQGNIVVQKGSPVSIKVIPHCVDASNTIWAIHHGWAGDQNFYIFPDNNGVYGPVSWGSRPFVYSGRPGGFSGDGDQQYTITFVAANRECDAKLRSLPRSEYSYDGPYNDGNQGGPPPPNDGNCPCNNGNSGVPQGDDNCPCDNNGNQSVPQDDGNCPCDYDSPGGPHGGKYVPNGYGGGGNSGPYGFKDIPQCCKRLGDVNFKFVQHYEHNN